MSYKHITIFERSCIYQFLNLGMSIREIDKAIKRSPEQIYQRSSLDNVKTPSTSTIYRLIKKDILPKVSMKSLRRKGNFKRPSEKRGKFNDRGRSIKKEIKVYIKE